MNAIQSRHHNVNNQKLDIRLLKYFNRLLSIVSLIDLITLLLQINLDGIYNFFVVITYQNIRHCSPSPFSFDPLIKTQKF